MLTFIFQCIHDLHWGDHQWTAGWVLVSMRMALCRNPRWVKESTHTNCPPDYRSETFIPPSKNLWWQLCANCFVPLSGFVDSLAIIVPQQHCPRVLRLLHRATGQSLCVGQIVFCAPTHPSRLHTMNRCGQRCMLGRHAALSYWINA